MRISILILLVTLFSLVGCQTQPTKVSAPTKTSSPETVKERVQPQKAEWVTRSPSFGYMLLNTGWVVECRQDKFDDTIECVTSKGFSSESVQARQTKFGLWLSFGLHDHPGRLATVRIGKHKAETYERYVISGDQAERVLNQMMTEPRINRARLVRWPSKPIEYEFDLSGFRAAYSVMIEKHRELSSNK